jgi:hypothetical protein
MTENWYADRGVNVRQLWPPYIPKPSPEEEAKILDENTVKITAERLDALTRLEEADFMAIMVQLGDKDLEALADHPGLSEDRLEAIGEVLQDRRANQA